jgi:3',5'-cyclic AMP phosphodiesterase CpdA
VRIIQISDTHLSAQHQQFTRNTDIISACISQSRADLIVHTGDLSMDGARDTRDLELSRDWIDRLAPEVLSVPGNHDVGDLVSIRSDQPVDNARLANWKRIIGPDRWVRDVGGWRIIGLNAMLLGTGHPEEDHQFRWLQTLTKNDRPVALFVHKPLCIDDLKESSRGYWTIAPEPRTRLTALLADLPVRLIASGHLHIERKRDIGGISHVWCPAASFVVGAIQENLGGTRRLGYIEHSFGAETVTSRFVRPDGLVDLPLDPVIQEIYPV